jgi:predicted ATPase
VGASTNELWGGDRANRCIRGPGAEPIVLVLEDVHAADESSLLLLRFVARTVTDARLLVIATTRSGDRSATEPFADTLADLARAQRFRHIRRRW